MIEGLSIRCNIGPVEVLRSPWIELIYKRRAVLSLGTIQIPDPEGEARNALEKDQSMYFRFGYRGEEIFWHEWEGTVEEIDQPGRGEKSRDSLIVRGVGLEKKLATTMITESFTAESASAVAKRLLEKTGLEVAGVEIPEETLPHQVFSKVSVARAIKQLENTLIRSFGHDLSKHAVWLGEGGLRWSAEDEPGEIYRIETAENLLEHIPPVQEGTMGVITAVLLPGLTHSRKIRIRDVRRDISELVRAEEVIHRITEKGNHTIVRYGKDSGWG